MRPFIPLLLLLSTALATAQTKTSVHYDDSVNFTRYKTFRFVPGKVAGKEGRKDINKNLLDQQVRKAVTAALKKDGLTEGGEKASLTVTYIAGVTDMVQLQDLQITPGMNNEYPYKPGDYPGTYYKNGGPWETATHNWWSVPYERETFLLDIYDTRKKQLVWRCYAEAHPATYEEAALDSLLKAELGQFPPRPGKPK
jgi:hypothetical protein